MTNGQKHNHNGFGHIGLILLLAVLAAIGYAGWRVWQTNLATSTPSSQSSIAVNNKIVTWQYINSTWQPSTPPPTCPSPLLKTSPVDISQVTAVLYPGQTRGQYSSQGSFIFGNSNDNNLEAKLAMDAYISAGSRYIQSGSIQYMFEFTNSCGIKLRYDHLLKLSDPFINIAEALPQPTQNNLAISTVNSKPRFKAGQLIATAIGTPKPLFTVTMDFGVYDLRQPNEVSKTIVYAEAHKMTGETDYYGICWLTSLPGKDAATAKSLPAGNATTGKTSDYCSM